MNILLVLMFAAMSSTAPYTKTQADVLNFVSSNPISTRTFDAQTYNCANFSHDLVEHARANGFLAMGQDAYFEGGGYGHEFVAFATVDMGIIYIEPQNDGLYVPPQVGHPLCYSGVSCDGKPIVELFFDPATMH